jgi:hypothetical protein
MARPEVHRPQAVTPPSVITTTTAITHQDAVLGVAGCHKQRVLDLQARRVSSGSVSTGSHGCLGTWPATGGYRAAARAIQQQAVTPSSHGLGAAGRLCCHSGKCALWALTHPSGPLAAKTPS